MRSKKLYPEYHKDHGVVTIRRATKRRGLSEELNGKGKEKQVTRRVKQVFEAMILHFLAGPGLDSKTDERDEIEYADGMEQI
ncbi:hypothetical protein IFR05_003484 [Cadophora sp. M221]|nr:hypothetical protein IFR05_003484 [Cadophora sp. M221]